MSVLIFLGILFVLVLVHELGHFAVAKWTGMRVDEFGIGFPPKLFSITKGETTYSFNLFPVGGFVKIFGEDGVGDPSARPAEDLSERSEQEIPAGVLRRYDEDGVGDPSARPAEDLSERSEQKISRNGAFTTKSKWAQSAVLIAGVTMNILLAWVLMATAFGIGVRSAVSEQEAGPTAKLTITSILPESPAAQAQLPNGAVILGMTAGGDTLTHFTPSAFTAFIAKHASDVHTIVYTDGGDPRIVAITPKAGIIASQPDHFVLGVGLSQIEIVKRPFFEAITESFFAVLTGLRDITVGTVRLIFDAVRFNADFSQVAGPVGIVGMVGQASTFGITTLLMFTAFISLNLAVINILPFPALDGGRLLFVAIEALKGSPIRAQYVAVLNTLGFMLLILLMVAVTWNDIARLL